MIDWACYCRSFQRRQGSGASGGKAKVRRIAQKLSTLHG
jgi:hypothetical protein